MPETLSKSLKSGEKRGENSRKKMQKINRLFWPSEIAHKNSQNGQKIALAPASRADTHVRRPYMDFGCRDDDKECVPRHPVALLGNDDECRSIEKMVD